MKNLEYFFESVNKIHNLDWETIDKLIPNNTIIELEDYATKKKFNVIRTAGKFHADVEPQTKEDYDIIKKIYNIPDSFESSDYHPVICTINGNKYAGAFMAFPHAGSTKTKPGTKTKKLTGGFSNILNGNYISDNNVVGHFCLHFKNSTRHTDNSIDNEAQKAIKQINFI